MEIVSRYFKRKIFKVMMAFVPLILIIIPVLSVIIAIGGQGQSNNSGVELGSANVSASVLAWKPTVEKYASQYDMSQYVNLILAVMQQESGGTAVDVMQASEGAFNKEYPKTPNGITDPDYSISCGIQELKEALTEAGAKGTSDIPGISLALQTYNFGTGFISYAKANGGYSIAVVKAFSSKEAKIYGWSSYGDVSYVAHVFQYYNATGTVATSGDLSGIISTAQQQEGKPYVWGGSGPNSFDCSGLVYYCYVNNGYKIQRETAQGYYDMSTKTTTPIAGDLVFFGSIGNIEHIGIYIGNNEMIDAPQTGENVKIQNCNWSDFVGYGHLNK